MELCSYFAPEAAVNLYRIVAEDGKTRRGNLVQAIADASEDDVDILNLSVGVYHHEEEHGDCGGHCRIADETRLAIEDGLTVVAATGNREKGDSLAVHCPALVDETIGVGGFVARCRHEMVEEEESGQYWVRDDSLTGPFCGQRGCTPDESCETHRYEYPWRGNVSFHNAVPDVLAPVHHPAGTPESPTLQSGTSFGTPIVSALLAAMCSDCGRNPEPEPVKEAIRMGASEIDEGMIPKYDAEEIQREFRGLD